MTGVRRILFVHGNNPVDLSTILGSLAGWDMDSVDASSTDSDDAADAIVLDGHLDSDRVHDLVSSLAVTHPSSPILLAIDSNQVREWASFLSLGIQDLIFVDTDTAADGLRRLLGAVHNHHLLRATQEAEIRLRTIIEHIDDGVLILSSDSEILFANPAAEYLLGQTLDDLFGLRVPFGLPTEGDEIVSLTTRTGDERMLSVQVHSVRWEGQDTRLLAFRDVTAEQEIRNQLRRARHAAEEAASMKSSFLANMSHELRMPLASIIGYADLIKDGTDDADLEEFAGSIKENGQRLLTTINAVLEATRLEKHHIEPQIESLRLDTLVDDVVSSLQPLVDSGSVVLRSDTAGPLEIEADEDFVVRILNNLIGNAIKFTDTGEIVISTRQVGEMALLEVRDTGRGISEEFLPQLFDEFSQESTGSGRSHEGTGLGLMIVKGMVDLLGGSIEVTSTPGEGSTFQVFIPIHSSD